MIDSFLTHTLTTVIGIIISLIGFYTTIVRNLVTKTEVEDMIQNISPYAKDKPFIMERLNVNKENQKEFSNALQRNIEVLTELKVQIATLGKTLEAIEDRIER